MTFETVDDVLEHFGVKGMHWGVRKQQSSSTNDGGEKKSAKKKRAIQVAVVAGVVVAGAVIAHKSGVRVSSFKSSPKLLSSGQVQAQRVLAERGRQKFSAIPMPPVPIRTPTVSKFRTRTNPGDVAALRSSIARSVRLANADLRARDNSLNIPIPQRSYIREWD